MSRRIPHKIQRYLEPKLSAIGRRSFETLCKAMCSDGIPTPYQTPPCHELAYWFDLLVTSQVKLADGRTINIRSLDSYRSALNGITLRKLRKIEREARALILEINRLKKSPLVRELSERDLIPLDDLLGRADFPCDSRFHGLLNLRTLAAEVMGDPRKPIKPDFTSDLSRIYRWIHQHSARWHDERVADILNDLFHEPVCVTDTTRAHSASCDYLHHDAGRRMRWKPVFSY